MAYLAEDGVSWDALAIADDAVPPPHENPWEHRDEWQVEATRERAARLFWTKLPDANRGRLKVAGAIAFDEILAIDEDGDGHINAPHVFVKFGPNNHPFKDGRSHIEAGDKRVPPDPSRKIKFFPDKLPEAGLMELGKIEDE